MINARWDFLVYTVCRAKLCFRSFMSFSAVVSYIPTIRISCVIRAPNIAPSIESRGGLMVSTQVRLSEGSRFKSRSGQIAYFHGIKTQALNMRDW